MTSTKEKPVKKPCGCGGSGTSHTPSKHGCGCNHTIESCEQSCECQNETCCRLACVTRPNYFCGHLLTDEDLRLEHTYFAEKLKMYHRTLDGTGVVCGLALSCDDCEGHIRVNEGYAIDDCGRDLVVCSSSRFDLIGELKRRGWIDTAPGWDPCNPQKEKPDCPDTCCFYVTLRYAETKDGYTTPLRGACNDGPSACEPTRIHETVCIELLREKPKLDPFGLQDVQQRLESVFESMAKSRYGQMLSDPAIRARLVNILNGEVPEAEACELFCQLQYLLLLYLRDHPPLLRCHLREEIAALHCHDPHRDPKKTVPEKLKELEEADAIHAAEEGRLRPASELFCKFFELVWDYILDEVLTALLPSCPPTNRHCGVVLGTVEVTSGKIVRICNTPRQYVFTFRNVIPLLSLMSIGNAVRDPEQSGGCCPDYAFKCDLIRRALAMDEIDLRKWVAAPIAAAGSFLDSYSSEFHMTNSNWAPNSLLQKVSQKKLDAIVAQYNLKPVAVEQPPHASILQPLTIHPGATVATAESAGVIKAVPIAQSVDTARVMALEQELKSRIDEIGKLHERINQQEALHAETLKRFEGLDAAIHKLTNPQ